MWEGGRFSNQRKIVQNLNIRIAVLRGNSHFPRSNRCLSFGIVRRMMKVWKAEIGECREKKHRTTIFILGLNRQGEPRKNFLCYKKTEKRKNRIRFTDFTSRAKLDKGIFFEVLPIPNTPGWVCTLLFSLILEVYERLDDNAIDQLRTWKRKIWDSESRWRNMFSHYFSVRDHNFAIEIDEDRSQLRTVRQSAFIKPYKH